MKKTKKQLKKPTQVHMFSISKGERKTIAGTNYAGKNPVYEKNKDGRVVKVQSGIPYVNLDKLDLS